MLTPEQLAGLPDEVVALFRDLEEFVIGDIARRIGKAMDMTATADGQIAIARAAGFDMRDVEARIRKTAELAEERVAEVMEKAAQVSVQAENVLYSLAGKGTANILSPALSALLHEGIAQTQGELRNLTQSLGFAEKGKDGVRRWLPAAQMYQTELDRALARVRSGACDRRTAVRSAVENLAKSGLSPKVTFETGHKDKLDVAVARAVRTGTNQMAARMTEHVMGELGAEYVETSAHPGARPSHAAWQGKVFHVGGDVDGYPDFESSTGYGDVAGLCGANCRHSF
ncbi:MAG: phage minor capsid protein, partial [Clostridiales Family XIII bacterium]|nr:phage minor capsid protein [Clostridiales Family XIII bacterium]